MKTDIKYYLGADVGGSHISCALINEQTHELLPSSYIELKVNSKGEASEILQMWSEAIQRSCATVGPDQISGVSMAMPGPFDYEHGISLIAGVDKFDSLFGVDVKSALNSLLNNPSAPIHFKNDAACFALGEYYSGAAKGSQRTLVTTLGTGFGSTFLTAGAIQESEGAGVPPNGYLYNIPFKNGIGDEYFSTRWFVSRWKEITNESISGVKEIAQKCEGKQEQALALFQEFATNLAQFMAPYLQAYQPDTWVIGGSIALAAQYFQNKLKSELQALNVPTCNIEICQLWDKAPIVGAAMSAMYTNKNRNMNDNLRSTKQFLAPAKVDSSAVGRYDIYPAFPIGDNKIFEGVDAVAQKIAGNQTVVIDGYGGVLWSHLIEQLSATFKKLNKTVTFFRMESAYKSPTEIDQMLIPYLGGDDPVFGKITDKKLIDWFDTEKLNRLKPTATSDLNILIGCGASLAGWEGPILYVDVPKNEIQFRMRANVISNLGADKPYDHKQMYKRFFFVDWVVLNEHKCNILPQIDYLIDEQRVDHYLMISGDDLREGLARMSKNFFRVRPWFEPGAWGGSWMKEHIDGLNKEVPNLAWSFELMVLENGIMFESNQCRLEVSFDFLMFNNYREVLGDCAERFKYDFPIRFDFLDTIGGGNLSVQCHPRPEYIKEQFGMPFTQDETYYILDCEGEPTVYLGFQEEINPEAFHQALTDSQLNAQAIDIEQYVQKHKAKKHDLFLIPNGTIHASGSGNMVLEISSAPYIFTFKMYDWMRLDLDGKPRPINIEHGMNNLYFDRKGAKVTAELISKPTVIEQGEDFMLEQLPTHPNHFYDIYRYTFQKSVKISCQNKCHVWMLVEGTSVIVETANGMKQRFNYAETFVIPAAAEWYTITNEGESKAMMVNSFVR